MTEIHEGLSYDLIRVNRLHVRNILSDALCQAFMEEHARTGITLKELGDKLGLSEADVLKKLSTADADKNHALADITLALDMEVSIQLIPRQRMDTHVLQDVLQDMIGLMGQLYRGDIDMQYIANWITKNFPDEAESFKR